MLIFQFTNSAFSHSSGTPFFDSPEIYYLRQCNGIIGNSRKCLKTIFFNCLLLSWCCCSFGYHWLV